MATNSLDLKKCSCGRCIDFRPGETLSYAIMASIQGAACAGDTEAIRRELERGVSPDDRGFIKTLSPKLAHLLPPELVRKVVEHWLHAGFYEFTA